MRKVFIEYDKITGEIVQSVYINAKSVPAQTTIRGNAATHLEFDLSESRTQKELDDILAAKRKPNDFTVHPGRKGLERKP